MQIIHHFGNTLVKFDIFIAIRQCCFLPNHIGLLNCKKRKQRQRVVNMLECVSECFWSSYSGKDAEDGQRLGGHRTDTESQSRAAVKKGTVGLPTLNLTLVIPKSCLLNVQGLLSHFAQCRRSVKKVQLLKEALLSFFCHCRVRYSFVQHLNNNTLKH